MSVGLYLRASTGKPDQEHGLEAQRRACLEFIRERGLGDNPRVYQDQASGRKADRPELNRLLQDAAMKRVRALVVFRLDRLTRGGIAEMFRLLKALRGYGVRVYSVSETWWDPEAPTAELILAILAWAAAFESRSIGERVSMGIHARKAEAQERGEAWLWGRGRVSKLAADPRLPARALELRLQGLSWSRMGQALGVGRTTARRLCQIARGQGPGDSRGEKGADGGST